MTFLISISVSPVKIMTSSNVTTVANIASSFSTRSNYSLGLELVRIKFLFIMAYLSYP